MLATIRDMRLFIAAYEERSFTAAAAREEATQSGVSQHIGKLEELLGARLFFRGRTGITTTPVADTYYSSCLEVLRLHEGAHTVLTEYTKGINGRHPAGAYAVDGPLRVSSCSS